MSRSDLFPSVYMRDWRNANRFKPNFTPPRLNFNGFVDFVFNPEISAQLGAGLAFRTQISSLVQTASLPQVTFNTDVKNQYNIRRVVQTGINFSPVTITVLDTVSNEWLLMFMRYFSYHYMQPRNKTNQGTGNNRDLNPKAYLSGSETWTRPSAFMADTFESNAAGLNSVNLPFLDQVKLITYAGGKGVEYILFKPTITTFGMGEIDYSTSETRKFTMAFEYENFTINEKVNFNLDSADRARFESYNTLFVSDILDSLNKAKFGYRRRDLEFLGTPAEPAQRTPHGIPAGEKAPPSSGALQTQLGALSDRLRSATNKVTSAVTNTISKPFGR
jgi:hypothetical protein